MKCFRKLLLLMLILLLVPFVFSDTCKDFFIDDYNYIPYKSQMTNSTWSNETNMNYDPVSGEWDESLDDSWSFKCLSYAASSVLDWYIIQEGGVLPQYTSYVRGINEVGVNPRHLETLYHDNHLLNSRLYKYAPPIDPLTNENVPWSWVGYSDIISNFNFDNLNIEDNEIDDYTYNVDFDSVDNIDDYETIISKFSLNKEQKLIRALENKGVVYFSELSSKNPDDPITSLTKFFGVHALLMVGYRNCSGDIIFYYHDSDNYGYTKTIEVNNIDKAYAFIPKGNWDTYRHDNRRTGLTLLKGDLNETHERVSGRLAITSTDNHIISRPSIGEVVNGDLPEVVSTYAKKVGDEYKSFVLVTERYKYRGETKFRPYEAELNAHTSLPPSIGDLNGDGQNDIVVTSWDQVSIYTIEGNNLVKKAYLETKSDYCDEVGTITQGIFSGTAIADIDNDGKNNLISTDDAYTCTGFVYDYEFDEDWSWVDNSISLGSASNGVEHGHAISIANLDDDPALEVIVPSYEGIIRLDLNIENKLSIIEQTTDNRVSGSAVIYDIDRDNEYEIIYPVWNANGDSNINIVDSNLNSNEGTNLINLDYRTFEPIGVANFDKSDSNLEMVVVGYDSTSDEGFVECYDYETGDKLWTYPDDGSTLPIGANGPNIVDIDGNGDYEIVVASTEDFILILNGDGTLFREIETEGILASSPAIGAVSDKGVAELTLIRTGSPYEILTTITGTNYRPELNISEREITALAGELIDLNRTGEIYAYDEDGDELTFSYSYPFNQWGKWQTINSSSKGEYNVSISVSDGELTTTKSIKVLVFNGTRTNTFADGSTSKVLVFTENESMNIQIHLRVDPTKIVEYASIFVEGGP